MQIANFINSNGNGNNSSENEDVKVEGVTIPKGFYYVGGTKADGIVISDAKADENKYKEQTDEGNSQIPGDGLVGNQFVWVPVENTEDFVRYPGYNKGDLYSIAVCDEPLQNGYDGETEEYNLMKQSVEKNKGFYVARYEAGKQTIDGVDTVVSKKGANVWNYIMWGDSMTSIGTEGAVAKSKEMYTNKSKFNVTSTLIYGVQWDAIMAWIDPDYKTSNCEGFLVDSYGKGNYDMDIVYTSGLKDSYRVNNIYDLAGNAEEWTMETYEENYRVTRGGNFQNSDYSASSRDLHYTDGRNNYGGNDNAMIGFRVALYI